MKTLRKNLLFYAKDKYQTCAEYPWASSPSYAVLRHGHNKKWYGVIMQISKDKLELEGNAPIDVVNLKCPTEIIGGLVDKRSVFPAYHMNKSHWISVVLDGRLDKKEIYALVDLSYNLTK